MARLLQAAQALAGAAAQRVEQDDTFFNCERGRLKLCAFPERPGHGELIFYQRADAAGPKASFYELSTTRCADELRRTLSLAYGQAGRVRKIRRFVKIGRSRVHLDQVEGLGDFMELEVELAEGESELGGQQEAQVLMLALGLQDAPLIAGAYTDLLQARKP